MFALSEKQIIRGMMDAALLQPGARDVSLAFIVGAQENKAESLRSFVGEPTEKSFQKILDLTSLHVADGYHRSAYQILQVCVLLGYQMADIHSSNSLRILANKMLEGTFKIGALTINGFTRALLAENWPEVAAHLPESESAVTSQYYPPFAMGYGEIVNQLRNIESSDTVAIVERARNNASQVVDDLFVNGVYGWIVTFL